jgi:hypothetical protein
MKGPNRWVLLIGGIVVCCFVLSFYQTTSAQTSQAVPPFANSIEQRMEITKLLAEIRDQIKEQNALLRSGELRVIVVPPKKDGK